jgi:hypothetical protein
MSTRRTFLIASTFASAATLLPAQNIPIQQPSKPKPPALESALVKELVIAGHADLGHVREMLHDQPALINSAWDWGGGDFEMAIGGAGHMGRPDIARFLISQGSRFDIFVAAMLGNLDLVKNYLTLYPNLAQSKGPHGIPLIVHAQKGGPAAEPVLHYLQSLA